MSAFAWERHCNETAKAFEAFAVYRDLGLARSLALVAQKLGKSRALIDRWSARHGWVERAAAWDVEQDRTFRTEVERARRNAARQQAKLASAFLAKVLQRLDTIQATDLSPTELIRWFEVAARVERAALGMDGRVEMTGSDGGPIQVEPLSAEDRRSRLRELTEEATRRLGVISGRTTGNLALG